jgi:hypothetical protein
VHLAHDVLQVEGLAQDLDLFPAVDGGGLPGEEKLGRSVDEPLVAGLLQEAGAGLIGEPVVDEEELVVLGGQALQRRLRGQGSVHAVALGLQHRRQQRGVVLVSVHDEDAPGRAPGDVLHERLSGLNPPTP